MLLDSRMCLLYFDFCPNDGPDFQAAGPAGMVQLGSSKPTSRVSRLRSEAHLYSTVPKTPVRMNWKSAASLAFQGGALRLGTSIKSPVLETLTREI